MNLPTEVPPYFCTTHGPLGGFPLSSPGSSSLVELRPLLGGMATGVEKTGWRVEGDSLIGGRAAEGVVEVNFELALFLERHGRTAVEGVRGRARWMVMS